MQIRLFFILYRSIFFFRNERCPHTCSPSQEIRREWPFCRLLFFPNTAFAFNIKATSVLRNVTHRMYIVEVEVDNVHRPVIWWIKFLVFSASSSNRKQGSSADAQSVSSCNFAVELRQREWRLRDLHMWNARAQYVVPPHRTDIFDQ